MDNVEFIKLYKKNKKAVWIKAKLSNGKCYFYDTHKGWLQIKEICDDKSLFISDLRLQYRSHEVTIDISNCDGVYLIRSVMGQWGADSREFYTVGLVNHAKVSKKMYMIPELIVDKEYDSTVDECFTEAMIYDKRKNRKK